MRFCQSCNNLLYPKENSSLKTLEYICKSPNCRYIDKDVDHSCVFVNELVKDSSTRLEVILSDLNKDPTLQRTPDICCAKCQHNEAVFFQAELNSKSTALNLVYICCKCGYKWMDTN